MDANSLYPTAMCLPLPVDQFTWVDNVDSFNVTEQEDDAEYGYILEIDGETPVDKHDVFSDYPLTAEKIRVKRDMLSPFEQEHFPPGTTGTEKLVPHLGKIEKYVVHYTSQTVDPTWIQLDENSPRHSLSPDALVKVIHGDEHRTASRSSADW